MPVNAQPVPAPSASPGAVLDVNTIFGSEPLTGRLPDAIDWAPDGSRFVYTLPGGGREPLDLHVYDARHGRDHVYVRAAAEGKGARPADEFAWSPDSRELAFLDAGDLWAVDADGAHRRRLAGDAEDPQWSPDARRVAYVHAGDLYIVAATGGRPARYTFDGSDQQLNGEADWVYSEEFGMRHAYRWAPDGRSIAYLHFDERPVAPFPIVDFLVPVNAVDQQRYPLAGGANAVVSLRVVGTGVPEPRRAAAAAAAASSRRAQPSGAARAARGGAATDLYTTAVADDYIASVDWTPTGAVAVQLLDRSQKRLRYASFGPDRKLLTLSTERDGKWVDVHETPHWLRDKAHFLFLSDRDGQTALYLGGRGGARRLTRDFAATELAGVDEKRRIAYVQAAYPTRRDSTLLAVPLGGGAAQPLTDGGGTHRFTLAPDAREFVRADSAFGVPPIYTLGSTTDDGLVTLAQSASLANLHLGRFELFTIDSPFGKLDAWMIKPPDFDPAKRYPVIDYVYGGPASPTTANRWGGSTYLYHQALAQRGFIVFSVDGPGSQIDSAAAVRQLYRRLGPASLAGQLAGIRYLRSLPYVDPARVGIWGWSFGGYETVYALTHSTGAWKAGIAVAPVTDWRYYDSIYTERYMGLPQQDPEAYRASSAVEAAGDFAGRLLISHGTADENVHIANSVSLLQALLLGGKQVDFMVYPRKGHGIEGIPQRQHLFTHMLEYWQANL